MKWKVCGMRDEQNINEVLQLQPDWMGFIFYDKSPRYVLGELSPDFLCNWPHSTKKVGVFVNPSIDWLLEQAVTFKLDIVQIHGASFSDSFYKELKKVNLEVIQVVGVEENIDFDELARREDLVDYFLFDTKSSSHGGTGKSFDWNLLSAYPLSKPFLLAGGISLENFEYLPNWQHVPFWGIDVNSRFEDSPAYKNKAALAVLTQKIDEFNKH